jgi:hypothetical protein
LFSARARPLGKLDHAERAVLANKGIRSSCATLVAIAPIPTLTFPLTIGLIARYYASGLAG